MKEKLICSMCGKELTSDTAKHFRGNVLCNECFEQNTTLCDCCGERIWSSEAQGDSNIELCDRCYENYYIHCDDCGRVIHNDDAFYEDDSDYPYCYTCYTQRQGAAIKSYNYKPEPIFYGSGNLFMGVELEIDKGGESHENAETLLSIANLNGDYLYAKHDGSIDYGFELVSHPMTLDYHTDCMNWNGIFEAAVNMGYRSHQTQTCGLHIHVNRSAFGDTLEKQEDVISRIVYFVENHWNELLKFSRRTEASINRWASRYGILTTAKDTYKNAKDKRMGRYVAVNLENYSTIEFRIFRGTLCYKTFIATLQLISEICNAAIRLSDKELEGMSWSDFVSHITKPELIEYLKSKRLYINEILEGSEEM